MLTHAHRCTTPPFTFGWAKNISLKFAFDEVLGTAGKPEITHVAAFETREGVAKKTGVRIGYLRTLPCYRNLEVKSLTVG